MFFYIKNFFFNLKSMLLRTQNFTILSYNQKNNPFKIAFIEVGFYIYYESYNEIFPLLALGHYMKKLGNARL